MPQTKTQNLVVNIAKQNQSSFLKVIIPIALFALCIAGAAVAYILNRRKLIAAKSKLRELGEEVNQLTEDIHLTKVAETRETLEQKRAATQEKIGATQNIICSYAEKCMSFEDTLDQIKSWGDFKVTP